MQTEQDVWVRELKRKCVWCHDTQQNGNQRNDKVQLGVSMKAIILSVTNADSRNVGCHFSQYCVAECPNAGFQPSCRALHYEVSFLLHFNSVLLYPAAFYSVLLC